jgi:hypothetical protein
MYNIIDTEQQLSTPKRKVRFVFDPFLFTLILLILCSLLFCIVYYLLIFLPPIIYNFNTLIATTIPNELQYYHSLTQSHNQTITIIEKNILSYLSLSEIVVNKNTLNSVDHIIFNMEGITSTLNVTQIQTNLEEIVNILNRVIPH